MKLSYPKASKKLPPLVLIGGVDPTGNAGLFADAKVLQHYKIVCYCIPTAITVQSDEAFVLSEPVSLSLFRQQLQNLPKKIKGLKIGMLATLQHTKIIIEWLQRTKPQHVVWDPVIRSSSGGQLLKTKQWNPTLKALLAQCHLFTPNIPETEWILRRKLNSSPFQDTIRQDAIRQAAQEIFSQGNPYQLRGVLIKGGHAPYLRINKQNQNWVEDILWNGKNFKRFRTKKKNISPRGTGCTLASALLAELYLGNDLMPAIRSARRYLQKSLFKER